MKQLKHPFLVLVCLLLVAGVVLAQNTTDKSFAIEQVIGAVRPQGIIYNANFDQFALVNPQGQLVLADARNYQVQYILHENGSYNGYAFSHDGQWLAVAIDQRIELWNVQNGELAAQFEPDGALRVTGPLLFASDDVLLNFTAIVRAPAATRRSENDTSQIPWLWDLPAAREEGRSTLPRGALAYTFFDFRNGFVLGPNDKALAALPQRLLIIDVADPELPVIAEIPSQRFERDPISVWFSLNDEQMYVRPINQNNLFQIQTKTGTVVELPIGRELDYQAIHLLNELTLSKQARIIGASNSHTTNPFIQLLLGADYRRSWNYHPLTITLIDILKPITLTEEQTGFLVYILDEQTGRGMIDFVGLNDTTQFALHPENQHLMVRRSTTANLIEVYDMETGLLTHSYFTDYSTTSSQHPLAFTKNGDAIVTEFERIDVASGEILYRDLSYSLAFNQFFFTQDSKALVAFDGFNWSLWDVATGQVIRRETVNLRGDILQISPDGHRFLTRTETALGPQIEVVDVGTNERHSLIFEQLPGRELLQIIPSPNWENYIVVYSASPFTEHFPGNEMGLYNLYEGKRWFLGGDDLVGTDYSLYGWLDDATTYVYAEGLTQPIAPRRIYDLEYHPSGLPLCLVQAFPESWMSWLNLWERLNQQLNASQLGILTVRLCNVIPGTTADVEAVFHPSPTPTRIPATPRPAVIAGVPACLTERFPSQALDYARDWREITVGLSPEQITELEALLCEGLNSTSGGGTSGAFSVPDSLVMLINAKTGVRSFGTYLPPQTPSVTPNLQLVLDEFRRTERTRLNNTVILSPDFKLMAAESRAGSQITIYRLLTPYETLEERQQFAAEATQAEAPRSIAVVPTATQPFTVLGEPRPTFTPTMTPTSPPPAELYSELTVDDKIEEFCPADRIYSIQAPPADYAAMGRLFVVREDSNTLWVLNPADGHQYPDETIPACDFGLACNYAFDQKHILVYDDTIYVAKPDGSAKRVLFTANERPIWPADLHWVDNDTLEYTYSDYIPDRSINPFTFVQRIELDSLELPEPILQAQPIVINELPTDILSYQPAGPLAVVRTSFATGTGAGYKYYLYDRSTEATDYFARLANAGNNEIEFAWHPLGLALYYRYPDSETWYVYDTAKHEHRILGDYPAGIWSRDGRYKARWFSLSSEEINARIKAGQSIPKLSIWDSQTGQTRQYCIPQTDTFASGETMFWSPDNRYLVFRLFLSDFELTGLGSKSSGIGEVVATPTLSPDGVIYEVARPSTLVLDTQTGTITELTFDVSNILLWTQNATEESR